MATFLKDRLESKGFQVETVECGREALRYLEAHQPSLVILDIGLPDISGYEVCEELRKRYSPKSVPVLMLTAKGQLLDKLRGFDFGTDAYLSKPFDLAELEKTIGMLLR